MAEVTKNVVMQFLVPGTDDPDVGTAIFYPVVPLLFSDNSTALGSSKIVVPFDNEGKLNGDTGVPLTCNDSPALTKSNTYWIMEVAPQFPNPSVPIQKYIFVLLSTMSDPVDLTTILQDSTILSPQYNYATQSDLTAHVVKTIVTDHVHGGLEAPNVAGRVPTSGGTGPNDWTWAAPSSGGHTIADEGTPLAQQPTLNFTGAGVTATNNVGANRTDVTIPGASGTVTAVTGTPPITSSGGTTPAIGISAATTSTPGAVTLATPSSDTTAGHVIQANDTRLSDPRVPTAHASTHISTGSDPIAAAVAGGAAGLLTGANATKLTQFVPATGKTLTVSNSLTLAGTDGNTATVPAGGGTLVITTDPRLSDPRVPTAHASTHASGGSDPLLSDATPLTESGSGDAGTAILGSKADHVHPAVAPDDPTVGGDLDGTASAATVIGLQGVPLADIPTEGQLLYYHVVFGTGAWRCVTLLNLLGLVNPGDLLYLDGGGSLARLPVGSEDQRLTVVGGLPTWTGPPIYNEVGTVSSGHITLSHTPIVNSERIYRNGARQTPGTDYTISGNDITILWTPTGGDTILMDYDY